MKTYSNAFNSFDAFQVLFSRLAIARGRFGGPGWGLARLAATITAWTKWRLKLITSPNCDEGAGSEWPLSDWVAAGESGVPLISLLTPQLATCR
jgi:hypothetical protein